MVSHDHWMARRLAHARFETDRLQVGDQPLGSAPAVRGIGRIGGDRLDPQQREQAVDALLEIAIDAIENRTEYGHIASFRICGRHPIPQLQSCLHFKALQMHGFEARLPSSATGSAR